MLFAMVMDLLANEMRHFLQVLPLLAAHRDSAAHRPYHDLLKQTVN